jgi:hypothetical protein
MKKLFLFLIFSCVTAFSADDNVSGTYTYRSFHNNPALVGNDINKIASLLFGEGVLTVSLQDDDTISGKITFGGAFILEVTGHLIRGSGDEPDRITLAGHGRAGTPTAGWLYEYKALTAPKFDHAVSAKEALVGTVIRTNAHGSGGPGYTASFIMVKN